MRVIFMTLPLYKIHKLFAQTPFVKPGSAVRHVSLIAGGTVVAQVIGILTIPIVSRIYSPSDYGVTAVYAFVVAVLGELSGLRYYFAIPLPKNEKYAKAIVVLSLGLHVVFVIVVALILFIFGDFLLRNLSLTELIPYRALVPLGLLATGIYVTLTQWSIREKLFSPIARTKITQSLSGSATKILLGLLGMRPLGLLIGTIVAQGGGILTLLRSLLREKGIPHAEKEDLLRVALRYRKFPQYDTFSGLFITIGQKISDVVFVALYSTSTAGLFVMAQQLLAIPSTFVGAAIGQVFLQRGSVAKQNGNLDALFARTCRTLMRLGFFPVLFISFFAPHLFSWFLGEQWRQAGVFARMISPWIAINFVYSPISHVFSILERQNIALFFELFHLPLRITALYLGAHFGTEETSLLFFVVVNFTMYLVKMFYLNNASGNSFGKLARSLFYETLLSLTLLSISFIPIIFNVNIIFLFLMIMGSLGAYSLSLWRFFTKKTTAVF